MNIMWPERVAVLRQVALFANLSEEVLDAVASMVTEYEIVAHETIFYKGDLGRSMYIIVAGQVRVHDGDLTFNQLYPGDIFGEMAALDPEPRSASVTALQPLLLYEIDREAMYTLMDQHTEVVQAVVHNLCDHLRARMSDMARDFTYIQQFAKVTATAAAIEAGVFEPENLNDVARRPDELGQLARVFQRMIHEVYAREQRLRKQVHDLRIMVDHIDQARQVAKITESDYFQSLQEDALDLRRRARGADQAHLPEQ